MNLRRRKEIPPMMENFLKRTNHSQSSKSASSEPFFFDGHEVPQPMKSEINVDVCLLEKSSTSTSDGFFLNEHDKCSDVPQPMKSEISNDFMLSKESQSITDVFNLPDRSFNLHEPRAIDDEILFNIPTDTQYTNANDKVLDLSYFSTRSISRSSSVESYIQSDDSVHYSSIDSSSSTSSSSQNDTFSITTTADGLITEIPTTRKLETTKSKPKPKKNVKAKDSSDERKFDFEKYRGIISIWNIGDGKGNLVRCDVCNKYPDIVRRMSSNRKPPPITLSAGTGNRTFVLNDHVRSTYHLACMEKYESDKFKEAGKKSVLPDAGIARLFSAANVQKAECICRYLMSIYIDAKALTGSSYSWPGRIFTSEYSREYRVNQPEQNEDAFQKMNLQYMNPMAYADFLQSIVYVEKNIIVRKLESSLAISLRVDGSIDRTCIDKIYVLEKIVNGDGKLETLFLGVGEQDERGAKGLYGTIEKVVNEHEQNLWDKLLKKMSSFVTDGASINVGEHKGLWRLIDDAALAVRAQQPIMKIWCAAHRSDLAFKDLSKHVPEVPTAIKKCSYMSSFIRRSAVRLVILKKIAREKQLPLNMLPTYHEVRWSEFSLQLLASILTSWRSLVHFFQQLIDEKDEHAAEARGYLKFLTDYDNFQLLCFLADVLQIHSILQKQLQTDTLNIILLDVFIKDFKLSINNLHTSQLLGGWEESLAIYCKQKENGKYYVDDIEVEKPCRRVVCTRTFTFLREEILSKIKEFTTIRFSTTADISCDIMMPFFQFKNNEPEHVRSVHKIMAPDVDITDLRLQFQRICTNDELKRMALPKLLRHLVDSDSTHSYKEIILVLARLVAATPHSADVERTISANNLLKTALKSSLRLYTENNFLFIHFNLPPFAEWDPRNAANYWLTIKERRVHNLTVENENRKTKKQSYFKGVFPQAAECDDEDDSLKLSEIAEPTKKRRCF